MRNLLAVWCGCLVAMGCGDDDAATAPPVPTVNPPAGGEVATPDGGASSGDAPQLNYRDEDFVEAETNRDPFRDYARMFEVRPVERPQVAAVMPTTSIDDMQLTAIVSGVASPRAMLVDPVGVGHVVRRGDFVGRPEIVQTGGTESVAVPIHWRVERIRDNAVVLSRDDATAPNRPPLTRVLQLYEEER